MDQLAVPGLTIPVRPIVGLADGVGLLEDPVQVHFVDLLAADVHIDAENFGLWGPGAEVDRDRADGFLRHLFGHVHGLADGVLCGIDVDNRAVFQATAKLVAGTDDTRLCAGRCAAFCGVASGPCDQTADLAGADIEDGERAGPWFG
jgi:hypothetical protein